MSNVTQLKTPLDEDKEVLDELFEDLRNNTQQIFALCLDEDDNVSLIHNFADRGSLAVIYFRAQEIMKELI